MGRNRDSRSAAWKRSHAALAVCVALGLLPAGRAGAPQARKQAEAATQKKGAPSAVIPAQELAGSWYARWNGRLFAVLSLTLTSGQFSGRLTLPQYVQVGVDGVVEDFGRQVETGTFTGPVTQDGHLRLSMERNGSEDFYEFTLVSRNRATLQPSAPPGAPGFQPQAWELHRSPSALHFSPRSYPPQIIALQKRIERMVRTDQAVRTGGRIDVAAMEAVDARHRVEVMRIFHAYGWPSWSLAGHRAAHGYWLLVQHQTAAVQRELLPVLRRAVAAREASPVDYAYLYDRVMVGEGKPQHWGTQAGCKGGKAFLDPLDDPAGLASRRKALHLGPEADYLKMLAPICRAMPHENR